MPYGVQDKNLDVNLQFIVLEENRSLYMHPNCIDRELQLFSLNEDLDIDFRSIRNGN